MKRVLVTGASGFIGANLVRSLLASGHEVHAILRAGHQTWRIREIYQDLRTYTADVQDRNRIRPLVASIRPDWVFDLVAYGNSSTQTDADRMVATNILGCMALLEAVAETGVEAFVHAGSSSEYGYKDHPACEDEKIEPNSYYAVTKAAATHVCQLFSRARDINAITLRFYSIYGPYEDPSRLIPTLVTCGLKGKLPPLVSPQIARDFVYVDDAVEAMLRVASMNSPTRGSVYNICSGIQFDLAGVVDVARKVMNIDAEPVWSSMANRLWDTNIWIGSPHLTHHDTEWIAHTRLESGLQSTIEWFKNSPEWLQDFYYDGKASSAILGRTAL